MKYINARKFAVFLPILALVLIILLFLWRGVTMQGIFFGADEIASDLLNHAYTYHEFFAADYLKKGQIPLWNPYIGSGLPIFGEAQTGVYYPFAAVLYYFLPPAAAFNWLVISSFIILSLGTYLYCVSLGLSKKSAFFSAVVFSLSGSLVGHLRHVPLMNALAFMPVMFFVCEKIILKPKSVWMAALAFLLFLSFSPGQLTTTYLLTLMLTGYFLIRLRFHFKEVGNEDLKPVIIFFSALIFGILLSAIVLVPATELIQYSTRANLSLESALTPEYKIKYLLLFLVPYLFGDPSRGSWDVGREGYWENIGYIGIFPIILALAAIIWGFKKKEGLSKSISILLFFNFLLLLGSYTFFYNLIRQWIPGFSFTRVPGRFLIYIDFFLSILAGSGLAQLYRSLKNGKSILVVGGIICLSIADLFYFGYNFNTVIPLSYLSEPDSVKFLKQDRDLYRIRSVGFEDAWHQAWLSSNGWRGDLTAYMEQKELVPPDINSLFKIYSPSFIYGLAGHYGVRRPSELDAVSLQQAALLGMENVKYLLSSAEIPQNPDLQLVFQKKGQKNQNVYIYLNKKWLPRAYLVGRALHVQKGEDVLPMMVTGNFNPREEIIIEDNIDKEETDGKGIMEINSYKDDRVVLDVNSLNGGFLVLSDTYYPGWKAYVDGKNSNIIQADYAYRAVYMDRGKHQVVFAYEPESVKWGMGISLSALAVLLILILYGTKKGF